MIRSQEANQSKPNHFEMPKSDGRNRRWTGPCFHPRHFGDPEGSTVYEVNADLNGFVHVHAGSEPEAIDRARHLQPLAKDGISAEPKSLKVEDVGIFQHSGVEPGSTTPSHQQGFWVGPK